MTLPRAVQLAATLYVAERNIATANHERAEAAQTIEALVAALRTARTDVIRECARVCDAWATKEPGDRATILAQVILSMQNAPAPGMHDATR